MDPCPAKMKPGILQCILGVQLLVHDAAACRQGETVEARWIDGSFKVATIVDVRDGPGGTCGQYELSWHHTHVCDSSSNEYWGDKADVKAFCFVSRDGINKCNEQLCEWPPGVASTKENADSPEEEDSSGPDNSAITKIALACLGCVALVACCVSARWCAHLCFSQNDDVDVENASNAPSPCRSSTLFSWSLSPKSINSSPLAKWFERTQRPTWPSRQNVVQPSPVATKVAQKHCQPERSTHQLVPSSPGTGFPPIADETQGNTLRQAACIHVTSQAQFMQSQPKPPKRFQVAAVELS